MGNFSSMTVVFDKGVGGGEGKGAKVSSSGNQTSISSLALGVGGAGISSFCSSKGSFKNYVDMVLKTVKNRAGLFSKKSLVKMGGERSKNILRPPSLTGYPPSPFTLASLSLLPPVKYSERARTKKILTMTPLCPCLST